MNMIAHVDEVDEGDVILGDTTVVGYFTQHPPPVNPRLKLIDYVGSVAEQRCVQPYFNSNTYCASSCLGGLPRSRLSTWQ